MFEIGIFCVIVLAVSYWAVLWLMGRREDVCTVSSSRATSSQASPSGRLPPSRGFDRCSRNAPRFPSGRFDRTRGLPEKPVQAAVPEQPAFRPERLEQLLASIKQDLNQLVQK